VNGLRDRLKTRGFLHDTEFVPNVDRAGKQAFYRSLSVLSTPALYGEAFGLYVLEALASGVPVVQPRHAAFPEIVEATGGGLICEPNPQSLAETIEGLLLDPALLRRLGEAGRKKVFEEFGIQPMARKLEPIFEGLTRKAGTPTPSPA
jgi:glycosyltransferase involved in cell wall biosynthesis